MEMIMGGGFGECRLNLEESSSKYIYIVGFQDRQTQALFDSC